MCRIRNVLTLLAAFSVCCGSGSAVHKSSGRAEDAGAQPAADSGSGTAADGGDPENSTARVSDAGTGGMEQPDKAHGGSGGSASSTMQGSAGRAGSSAMAPRAGAGGEGAAGAGGSAGASGQFLQSTTGSTARGFPSAGPWVSWYGSSGGASVVQNVAATFRVINIDVDPDVSNFSDADIQTLRASGTNRVLSYLNVGSCEMSRSYYSKDPTGYKSCSSSGALTTSYNGYPDEMWANLSNVDYQKLIVEYVASRLAARGVDGFYLDNLEVVEHAATATDGPCDSQCLQGGLDIVWMLRQRFPDKLIVMQNATSDVTRLGMTHGVAFWTLLDGVAHESVFSDSSDTRALSQMIAWRNMKLGVNGKPLWLASEDYVGACAASARSSADDIYARAEQVGLSAYVTDASAQQTAPCFW
jgi:cysteinyl-tRNA synthetase